MDSSSSSDSIFGYRKRMTGSKKKSVEKGKFIHETRKHIVYSSDDEGCRQGSTMRPLPSSLISTNLNSSDEEAITSKLVRRNPLRLRLSDSDTETSDSDEGSDEDKMVMSRATRMSITGIIPINADSDDFIQSDEESSQVKKSPNLQDQDEGSSGPKRCNGITRQKNLALPSCSCQVIYMPKHVRENELAKLQSLQEDRNNIRMCQTPASSRKMTSTSKGCRGPKSRRPVPIAAQPGKLAKQGNEASTSHLAENNLILEHIRNLEESLASRPPESAAAPAPRLLTSSLMPHQQHALAWLRWRETQRPYGGILADDMGLGKTITMISLILSDLEGNIDDKDDDDKYSKKDPKPRNTLVVCPASLLKQWASEVEKHCAAHSLTVCLHHGQSRNRMPHSLAPYNVVLTTYNILQRDNKKNGVLMSMRWRRVILDEAHVIRNPKSATSLAVNALHASRRWCLTGTPVQNKDLDLFALVKFLRVTPFDDLPMWHKWINNKSQGGLERLDSIVRCILLRRTKQQLQESGQLTCLPERTLHDVQVELKTLERNIYLSILLYSKSLFAQFLQQRAQKNVENNTQELALQGIKLVKSHQILVLLLRLRQVCCHCGLIVTKLDSEDAGAVQEDAGLTAQLNQLSLEKSKRKRGAKFKDDKLVPEQEGTSVAEAISPVVSLNQPEFDLRRLSSKTKAVMDCLRKNVLKKKGDKAVVVSQWTSVLSLVEQQLNRARIKCVTLSGNVAVKARTPLIDALNDPNSPVKVMLLSMCAGGVGLNLCGANHLLLLDPHWNPQLEQQAQDRVYRVGQVKHVHIYRFVCVDTVEQSIRELQEVKLQLAENVLTGARHTNSKLSMAELNQLFNMED